MRLYYPAKILLFGEHLLLTGATALTLPLPAFAGYWHKDDDGRPVTHDDQQQRLQAFAGYLEEKRIIDNTFHANLKEGLVFRSNIPQGYGLGSSGALCAGVYDRYVREKTQDPAALKAVFALMESFFHGNSSGIDPLTSYLERPLIVVHKTEVQLPVLHPWRNKPLLFLMDTRLPRQTGPLVAWFLEQWSRPDFRSAAEAHLLPAHETAIAAWMQADEARFWPALRQISAFQLRYFLPMVPDSIRHVWEKGLAEDTFYLKICGAGGGGYMLGFAPHTLPDLSWPLIPLS